ncbi:MAG: HAD-IC family P-type ATPase [Methanobacterium sp.]|jgi:potassium/sodium efflux P-type ATPase|uniref:cation-translocating P-type ATPase n=1 Tax=Methanobacterium sp. TaxID=2164 RepID=UPI002583E1A8|nr:HAD-IC family P-type ATPase [Methanobacterium sp.]MCC7560485.1 HAD-IC family P-type ATPase [Methanobacterium sp.]
MSNEDEWYQLSSAETFEILKSNLNGLTSEEAKDRLREYGYNELSFKKINPFFRFLKHFNNPLIYVLIVAAIVTAFLGDIIDVVVIVGVVIVNASIGFIQEGKAESSIKALEEMMVPECTVLRDGEKVVVNSRLLVPGDVVLVESGTKIPADLRIIQSKNLHADEAPLTGESLPVHKNSKALSDSDIPPADQKSMVFSGTFITQGSGRGVVVATGESTEMGKIAEIMKGTREIVTPLTKKIEKFTEILVVSIIIIAIVNFAFSMWFGFGFIYSFMASASLAVAVIPEGLPAVLTITLALGVKKMAQHKALIRKLPSVEALGRATVICSDKTGTLTKNEMTVLNIFCGNKTYHISKTGYEPEGDYILNDKVVKVSEEGEELSETLKAGLMCNNASLVKEDGHYKIIGDPTEGALIVSAYKAGVTEKSTRMDEIPFQSENQYMATLNKGDNESWLYVKGSPEKILKMCKTQMVEGELQELSAAVSTIADEMAGEALRVLGFAYKPFPSDVTKIRAEYLEDLTFLGLQGMMDPPREEVKNAIERSRGAGIRTVMITGDHTLTAQAISQKLGIASQEEEVVNGKRLSKMSDEDLYDNVEHVSVYARVAPEHKYRITTQLQKRGEIVAVTGDGVNDAPALKAADIGIAMGITGTDVSKEASDMVLADDNFASIVKAIEEGRHIFENIRKVILYALAANGGQGLIIVGSVLLTPFIPLFLVTLPLEPVQILWINLFDSLFLALPLIKEPKEPGLLNNPPRDPDEQIVNLLFLRKVGLVSLAMTAGALSIFLIFGMPALNNSMNELLINQAQTAAFATVILVHVFYLVTARSIHDSAFNFSPFSNKWILLGITAILASLLMIIYLEPLEFIFRTTAIPLDWWPLIILFALPGFLVIEVEKFLVKFIKRRKIG